MAVDKRNNHRPTSWPQVTDDAEKGYMPGSTWGPYQGVNLICTDATIGAARWIAYQAGYETLQRNAYVKPANFNEYLPDAQVPASDTLYLFPFFLVKPIDAVAVHVKTAGSAGSAAVFGLYPNDPVNDKPDLQNRLGGSLVTLNLTVTGDRPGTFTGGVRDYVGLHWLGMHIKAVATMPVCVPMLGDGKYIHRGDLTDVRDGKILSCYAVNAAYDGSAPGQCPPTGTSSALAPMPNLRIAP